MALCINNYQPWYNYQPLWCIVVIPWQNPLIRPCTMIQYLVHNIHGKFSKVENYYIFKPGEHQCAPGFLK